MRKAHLAVNQQIAKSMSMFYSDKAFFCLNIFNISYLHLHILGAGVELNTLLLCKNYVHCRYDWKTNVYV